MRILVVEDDALLAEGLVAVLQRANHAVDHASTGADAERALRATEFDLLVLDIGLPDIDGFELLRRLRAGGACTSVLVLTARDSVEDRVHGLDLGADDYLIKPFSVTEFEARVRALLRRATQPVTAVTFGTLQVDFTARRARIAGKQIDLTPREWGLLELFLSRPGRVFSKEQIGERILNYDEHLSANAIEVYVSRLRAKLEDVGTRLRTVRGFGYIWEEDA
jgi:two-component system OmpR family response regulator